MILKIPVKKKLFFIIYTFWEKFRTFFFISDLFDYF